MSKKRKIWIDRINAWYFSEPFNKFVVVARIKEDGVWKFERLFFNTREEAERLEEGQYIKY